MVFRVNNIILIAILVSGACADLEQPTVAINNKNYTYVIEKARELVVKHLNETSNEFVPGLVIGVSVGGEQKWIEGFGLANIENNVSMKAETVMEIGSITKSFTAALAARLLQEGKLDFDAPIRTYLTLDEFPDKTWNGSAVNITLRQLLTMTAGFPVGPVSELEIGSCLFCLNQKDRLILVRDKLLDFDPGTQFIYSNPGYELAGAIIESVLVNTTFDVAMAEMIQNVLGLNTTAILNTQLITPNLASFYLTDTISTYSSGMWGNIFLNDFHAAGAIISTMKDLLTYGQIWLDAYNGRSEHFLKQSTVKDAWTPTNASADGPLPYGLGWVIQNVTSNSPSGSHVVWHSGGTLGCRSILAIYPETDIIVTASVNLAQSNIVEFILDGRIADLFAANSNITHILESNNSEYPKITNEYLTILHAPSIFP